MPPTPPDVSTGTLTGDIRFTDTSAALQDYLGANHAEDSADAVRFYRPGSLDPIGTSGYDLTSPQSNSALSNTVWKVAGYSATLPVVPGGSRFLVAVETVDFAGGGQYRFGFRYAGTPASHQSPTVNASETKAFDVEECAEMVAVSLKLKGVTEDDIAPLAAAPNLEYICYAEALVDDLQNGTFNLQARSIGQALSFAELTRASGAAIDFPVRALGQTAKFRGACMTVPPEGSGYALNDSGQAIFRADGSTAAVQCGTGCSHQLIELPVQRDAGDLSGRFDIVGYDETEAQVSLVMLETGFPRNSTPFPLPSNQPEPASWSMSSVPTGNAVVTAGASIAGGDLALKLPETRPPNPMVQITRGGSLDLGATFVAKPIESTGTLLLIDPARTTWLAKLANTIPVAPNFDGETSSVSAEGVRDLVDGVTGSGATGGLSRGRLNGSYVPESGCTWNNGSQMVGFGQGCWPLRYRLLFSGLSPITGSLDGSDTLRTLWHWPSGARLVFKDLLIDHQQALDLGFSRGMPLYSKGEDAAPPVLPSLGVCLGQVEIEFVTDAATGGLFAPHFYSGGYVPASNPAISPADVWSYYNASWGTPAQESAAALRARVVATVPEGARYELNPSVSITSAVPGLPSRITLPQISLPASGTLACSEVVRACIKINSPEGSTAQALQVSIDDQPYCLPAGTVSLQVKVESNNVNVDSLSYRTDGGAWRSYCSPCGPMSASAPITITPDGQPFSCESHTIEVTASCRNGCTASASYSFDPCGCGSAPSTKQVAFFDVNTMKLMRLEDNLPVFPPVHVAGGAGPISFNAEGSKLAVRQAGQVRTFSATDGSELMVEPGRFHDFSFRPGAGAGDDRAFVERINPGAPLGLRTVLGGMLQTMQQIPGTALVLGVTLSAPHLAWSRDGMRVAVAFTRTAGTDDQRLVVVEWTVSGNALGSPSSADWQIPAGEELRAFAYETGVGMHFLFATTQAVYRGTADLILRRLFDFPVNRADIHRPFAFGLATAGQDAQAFFMTDGVEVVAPYSGSIRGLAVSDFTLADPILAVAHSMPPVGPGSPKFIALYRLVVRDGGATQLIEDRIYPAQEPAYPTFRPPGP